MTPGRWTNALQQDPVCFYGLFGCCVRCGAHLRQDIIPALRGWPPIGDGALTCGSTRYHSAYVFDRISARLAQASVNFESRVTARSDPRTLSAYHLKCPD
jgi:hypothetical protein